jgi:hypothetical protein
LLARLPYGVRYGIALIAWAGVVTGDIFLRIVFVPMLPFAWLLTGFRTTQQGVQLEITAIEFYTRPLMRMPRLLGRGRSPAHRPPASADEAPEPRLLKKVGDNRT